jgi:hypothetical protein
MRIGMALAVIVGLSGAALGLTFFQTMATLGLIQLFIHTLALQKQVDELEKRIAHLDATKTGLTWPH